MTTLEIIELAAIILTLIYLIIKVRNLKSDIKYWKDCYNVRVETGKGYEDLWNESIDERNKLLLKWQEVFNANSTMRFEISELKKQLEDNKKP